MKSLLVAFVASALGSRQCQDVQDNYNPQTGCCTQNGAIPSCPQGCMVTQVQVGGTTDSCGCMGCCGDSVSVAPTCTGDLTGCTAYLTAQGDTLVSYFTTGATGAGACSYCEGAITGLCFPSDTAADACVSTFVNSVSSFTSTTMNFSNSQLTCTSASSTGSYLNGPTIDVNPPTITTNPIITEMTGNPQCAAAFLSFIVASASIQTTCGLSPQRMDDYIPNSEEIAQFCGGACQSLLTPFAAACQGIELGDELTNQIEVICGAADACFDSATTQSCRQTSDGALTADEAYSHCFGHVSGDTKASLTLMTELSAGDIVLTRTMAGLSLERIVINQHKTGKDFSPMLEIYHARGSLKLTPDHVLLVDGQLTPAHNATPGSFLTLGNGEPTLVTRLVALSHARVINPITTAGTILASANGEPVVATTHPEWIAAFMLAHPAPMPFPLFHLLAYVFPEKTQAYYDAVIEPFFQE